MKKISAFLLAVCVTFISCNEKDADDMIEQIPDEQTPTPSPVFDEAHYKATIDLVDDTDNHGNAMDIFVSFRGAIAHDSISDYKIFLSKSKSPIEIAKAIGLSETGFTALQNTERNAQTYLKGNQTDWSGDAIVNGVEYTLSILSIGIFNDSSVYALSSPSTPITLHQNALVKTLDKNLSANDAVSIDSEGNIYVANYGAWNATTRIGTGTEVKKTTPAGDVSVFASGLAGPVGGAFDQEGNLYVTNGSNYSSGQIIKINPAGEQSALATIEGYPSGIAVGENGDLFVANYFGSSLNRIDQSGNISVFAKDTLLSGGVGIAFDSLQNLIVGNLNTGDILKVDPQGQVSLVANISPVVQGALVIGYLTVFEGFIYATVARENLIYKISLDGKKEVFAGNGSAGSNNGSLQNASFNRPNGIGIDKTNRILYISEGGGSLRYIDLD